MNKWENSFTKVTDNQSCYCSSNKGLFIPNRQLSALIAGCLFLLFFTFMTGYFLGKKALVEKYSKQLQEEAVADHIYTSLLANNHTISEKNSHPAPPQEALEKNNVVHPEVVATSTFNNSHNNDIIMHDNPVTNNALQKTQYYAQLIGFGTEKAAYAFVKKLSLKGINTEIKKRVSKTAKGTTSYWYQVITTSYSDKDELRALVDKIAREENIKGACIRSC